MAALTWRVEIRNQEASESGADAGLAIKGVVIGSDSRKWLVKRPFNFYIKQS